MRLGTSEIVLIIILALVIFGGGKVAGVGKALGQSIHDFKKSLKDDADDKKPETEGSEAVSKD
ncbi:MAG: twin-arginine translocase TatA/TatE family subunit [Treponema sp.]|nr:twin-arginine translocase TatA/TatE family subunit [Treponema sp.]